MKEAKFGDWQPIETAPKDGRAFLIYEPFEPAIEQAYCDDDGYVVPCSNRGNFWRQPTHWMPLPSGPNHKA